MSITSQFSQSMFLFWRLEIKAEEILWDWFASRLPIDPQVPLSQQCFHRSNKLDESGVLDGCPPLAGVLLSQDLGLWVVWGESSRVNGGVSLASVHSDQVREEANSNLFHEPWAMHQGHEQPCQHSSACSLLAPVHLIRPVSFHLEPHFCTVIWVKCPA